MNTYYLRRLRNGTERQKRRVLYKLGLRRLAMQMIKARFNSNNMTREEYLEYINAANWCEQQIRQL